MSTVCYTQPASIQSILISSGEKAVSNQAFIEGYCGDSLCFYSFGGIDSTLHHAGIHLESWRYNTVSELWTQLPNLPDTMGKIAMGVSRVDSIIYVIGGYHVFNSGSELSSNKVHRFNTQTNSFLPDGAEIPVPIDDHVQCTYRDSLIYVITGWSNSNNVNNVQIYHTRSNTWSQGTPVPNNILYKAFGASGIVSGDSIFYLGGAQYGVNFPARAELRIGKINPLDYTSIQWKDTVLNSNYKVYRSGVIEKDGWLAWVGGSSTTYNYNGVAYNGSGPVSPRDSALFIHSKTLQHMRSVCRAPMDIRSMSENSGKFYTYGGIQDSLQSSRDLIELQLDYPNDIRNWHNQQKVTIYPNPGLRGNHTVISAQNYNVSVYTISGELVLYKPLVYKTLKVHLNPGVYIVRAEFHHQLINKKLIIY